MSADPSRIALVTGGASGIGRAAAVLLGERGAHVVVADLSAEGGRATVEQIASNGGSAEFIETDVAEEASVQALVAAVAERHGRLDAAFNNAGIADEPQSWIDFSTERWRRLLAVDLDSVFFGLKHELKQMRDQEPRGGLRGQIVNTASTAAYSTAPGQPHYTAAKSGVLGLTRSAAQEFARDGIRVNTLCPGLTDTAIVGTLPDELRDHFAGLSPTGELAAAVDVAQAAVWLLSPESQWVNGQSLVVDGGLSFR